MYQVTFLRANKPQRIWFKAPSVAVAVRMARTLGGVLIVA